MTMKIVKAALLASSVAIAMPAMALTDLNPYIGVDYKFWGTDNDKRAADSFPDNFAGGNYFIGTQFHDNYALELGYTHTGSDTKTKTFSTGTEVFFATTPTANDQHRTRVSMRSVNLNLHGYYPVMDQLDLWGTLGIASVNPKVRIDMTNGGVANGTVAATGQNSFAFRIGAGLRYMFTYNWGARALVNWEQNSEIKVDFVNRAAVKQEIKPYDNDVSFSFGFFYQW